MTRRWDPELEQYRDKGRFAGKDGATVSGGMNTLTSATIADDIVVQEDYIHSDQQLRDDVAFAHELRKLGFTQGIVVPGGVRRSRRNKAREAVIIMRTGRHDLTWVREINDTGERVSMYARPLPAGPLVGHPEFDPQSINASDWGDEMQLDSHIVQDRDNGLANLVRGEVRRYERVAAFADELRLKSDEIYEVRASVEPGRSMLIVEASLGAGPGEYHFETDGQGNYSVDLMGDEQNNSEHYQTLAILTGGKVANAGEIIRRVAEKISRMPV